MRLEASLFGGFRLVYDGQLVTNVNQSRQQVLLAYLMLHAHAPQPRQYLAFLFWPDSTERQAHTNLRYTLYHLRRAFPPLDHYLVVDTRTLHWQPSAAFQLDIAEFESCIAAAHSATTSHDRRAALEQAVACYRGDLLPGCYDEWIVPVRERLRHAYADTLERLLDLLEHCGDFQAALGYASRLLHHDPLREVSYRRLMQLHLLNSDRASALRVYHDCAAMLERELGVEPGPETSAVYHQILDMAAPQPAERSHEPIRTSTAQVQLVGRQPEWHRLLGAWNTAIHAQAHFVLITGEAGIGKTRLAEELLCWARQRGIAAARSRSYAAEGRLAYAPVADWLRSDIYRQCLAQLDDVWLVEVARILPEILADRPDLSPPPPLTDSWQRKRLFEALARAVVLHDAPLVLLLDDLQWTDQETLEWLRYLLHVAADARLLVVGTARSEEVGPEQQLVALLRDLRRHGQATEIELGRLNADDTAALARQVSDHEIDSQALEWMYYYTEGTPLFVVETVRAGLDAKMLSSGARTTPLLSGSSVPLPPAIYAVIQHRLAQLSPAAREVASIAAVVGRSWMPDVVAAVSGSDEAVLVQSLDELWQRRIVREHSTNTYDFGHDRIRDVAYAEISPAQRRLLHRRVAEALETLRATQLDSVSGQIARHYEQAGLLEQAVAFYQRAGVAAQHVYANTEAIELFSRGLALVQQLPDTPQRARQELNLLLALASSIRVTKGWAAPEMEQVLQRGWALCNAVGDRDQCFSILLGLCTFHNVRGEIKRASVVVGQLLDLAQSTHVPFHLAMAYNQFATVSTVQGKFTLTQDIIAGNMSLYDLQQRRLQTDQFGLPFGVLTIAWGAHNLWCLGYSDRALQWSRKAIDMADDLALPFCQVLSLAYKAMLHQFRGERSIMEQEAEVVQALADKHDVRYYRTWARILRCWAQADQHPTADAIGVFQQALADFDASGAGLRRPYYLSLLAGVYGKAGQPERGLAVLDQAMIWSAEQGEHWWDAELHRLRGELLLAQGADKQSVEAAFQQALTIARAQQAKAFELRAATSMARLWHQQGRAQSARELLSDIYAWFTEGFHTSDLQAAQALLKALVLP